MKLMPEDPNTYERGLYDAYLNVVNELKAQPEAQGRISAKEISDIISKYLKALPIDDNGLDHIDLAEYIVTASQLSPVTREQSDGWISIEKELPENLGWCNDRVMFCCKAGVVRIGCYDYEFGDWTEAGGGIHKDVTYWKPLPAPPISPED